MADGKLTVFIAMSLDGFIAGKNDSLTFLESVTEEGEDYGYLEFYEKMDVVIMGRTTYDVVMDLVEEYPHSSKESYVITTQSSQMNPLFYNDDPIDLVKKLKADGKEIFCDGGALLINALLRVDQVDEIIISLIPLTLGSGTPLFQKGIPMDHFELMSAKSFSSGVVQIHYAFK